jgi:7-carboxy-7-deazaguanine synthase
VLTGGEPMVAPELPELCSLLRADGFHITIETAGTVMPAGISCDLASVSPKLSNSTPLPGEIDETWIARHEAARLQPAVLDAWMDHYETQFKFVVASDADLEEIAALALPVERVLLMPEGTTPEALAEKAPFVVEACKRLGYRYCPRVQIELFGNTRGT